MTDDQQLEERALDLLIQRSLEGLDVADERELDDLLRRFPGINPRQFDAVIAELDALPMGDSVPMPDALAAGVTRRIAAERAPVRAPSGDRFAWWAAAAAAVLAAAGWWSVFDRPPLPTAPAPAPPLAEAPEPTLRERVDGDADAMVIDWSATDDPAAQTVSGDVHWSSSLQAGYMRFRDLPANDPAREQYQLWIFDATRDDAHPVDGGLFDVAGDGEVIVPIAARLLVRDATLFAVTVEAPGGVVVSDRERLILVASAP